MNFKTILACATLGLVLFSGRLNAAVESDIVGYTTVECKSGFNLLGVPFANVDVKNAKISVQSIQGNFQENDQIQYWNGRQLNNLTYYAAYGSDPAGWYEADDSYSQKTFTTGEGFWIKVQQKLDVTIAGKVVQGETGKVTAPAKSFTLVALNYPQATKINDFKFTGLAEGDQIQYWNGKQLNNLTYYAAYGSDPAGWYEADDSYSEKTFEPGEGFWILPQGQITIEF